ncbi:hypothetical protein PORCRE_2123 [Porphyromonas crevioricanis JCM 15906]|uniref:Uncharacterized protein n=1 Tax=Porphyromonas crevioricanis JCM 15906 TaxID=1305617 RepID=T1DTU1_9PORP|nr:hypothetical protein PORCRE_2123 [Porphyromonas crevioricanis JCM 15906]
MLLPAQEVREYQNRFSSMNFEGLFIGQPTLCKKKGAYRNKKDSKGADLWA